MSDRGSSVCLGTQVDKRSALALVCLFVVVFATLLPSAIGQETPSPNVLAMSSFTESSYFLELEPLKILEQVSALPPHTTVFAQMASHESADSGLTVFDLVTALGQRFPTYGVFNYRFKHGCIGGSYPDEEEDRRKKTEIAAHVLSGEKPESIPAEEDVAVKAMVDWRELRRWNIPESLLTSGSIVLYQPAPFWQRYKWSIGLAIFFVLELLLAGGYWLFQRTQRKCAEESVARQVLVEILISQISSDLINTSSTQIGSGIRKSLMTLRHFLGVDRISIYKLTDKEGNLRLHHSAREEGRGGAPALLMRAEFPWFFARLMDTVPIFIPRSEDLPSEAAAELELFREINLHGLAVFPLNAENRLVGVLSLAVVQDSSRHWWEEFLPQLKTLSQVYANAFALELSQEALVESESRFRVLSDATPAFIWMADQTGKFTYLNRRTVDFTGAKPEELNGNGWFEYIHPDDRRMAFEMAAKGLEQHEKFVREYRVKRHDGEYRRMFDVGNPRFNAQGAFVGFIGSAMDVTEQQQAREALESVGGQLIEAQERERSYIARELHDDVCQRLSMLSLRIEKVAKGWSNGKLLVREQLQQIWQQCSDLTGDVQALSHELHPSILDNLGLVAAVRSFCREFSKESGATVEFIAGEIPASLPRAVSLSLFRVIQEALHNAAKYSGEKYFEVHLRAEAGEIELEVSDRGVGFEVAKVKHAEGLGLVSMYERIHLLNGRIVIESKPNLGTKIRAQVPVTAQQISLSARAS